MSRIPGLGSHLQCASRRADHARRLGGRRLCSWLPLLQNARRLANHRGPVPSGQRLVWLHVRVPDILLLLHAQQDSAWAFNQVVGALSTKDLYGNA